MLILTNIVAAGQSIAFKWQGMLLNVGETSARTLPFSKSETRIPDSGAEIEIIPYRCETTHYTVRKVVVCD